MRVLLIVALAGYAAVVPVAGQDRGSGLEVSLPGALQPGGVALLTVRSPGPLASIEGDAFGRPLRFWSTADSLQWHGLVAPGLEAKPGSHDVVVRGTRVDGAGVSGQASVAVDAKRFETRRLKVDPQFVNPPSREADRIAREAKLLARLFTGRSDRLWRGPFVLPVPGAATSSFGRLTVLNGESRGRHQGADFRAASGTLVHAPNAGRVVLASDLYFSGNTVVLDHGLGMFSLFGHLSRMSVSHGDVVGRGDALGESGATGRVTGPHLHWALRLGELSVDPLSLIGALADLTEPKDASPPR
ncbi:MAG TPA: M23 family metallopeptidase [Vicinamibacterales bacterium]|nr:M23 family metallopeptidase [Vicinamibacterales bacterium]